MFMECVQGMLCSSRTRQVREARLSSFLENGSQLLEGLLASSDGRYGVPFRTFTAKELNRATTNFKHISMWDGTGCFYRGCLQDREVLVKLHYNYAFHSYFINDIVVSLQMCHHNNVLKLFGCCLEFKTPALVYEYDAGNTRLLSDVYSSLSWRVRLKLAVDIANALVYLHTAFATPIIHRDLCARNVFVCTDGVAKLLDFSFCISLPPGESQVGDMIVGVTGYGEPEYSVSGIITEKTDVYMFGVLLLQLLTGGKTFDPFRKSTHLVDHVEGRFVSNQVDRVLDPTLLVEKSGRWNDYEQQMKAFADLALRCAGPRREDRPDMISVAKELVQIKKSVHLS